MSSIKKRNEVLADKYAGERCTLNGKSANIAGRKLSHAYIRSLDLSEYAEFSWPTVERIMENGEGKFTS